MSFSEVSYQTEAVAAIEAALAMDRVPHGFIFCGPAGVGKALTARALAAVLLCDSPTATATTTARTGTSPVPTKETATAKTTRAEQSPAPTKAKSDIPAACGQCDQCRLLARGQHPDLSWYRRPPEKAEFTIGVVARGEHRESPEGPTINESVQLKAMQARSRVTVIEDAELMNPSAGNAFLKTFEEAPDGSYLILLVTSLGRLLPTIRSRGRLIRFKTLPDAFVAELLQRDHGLSATDAALVARFAEGGMDQAAVLARSDFLAIRRKIMEALPKLDRAAALQLADAIFEWADDQAKSEVQTDVKVEENQLRRLYLKRALDLIVAVLRDALLVGAGLEAAHLVNQDAGELLKSVAARVPQEKLDAAVRQFLEYQTYVDRNVHNQLLLETACLELSDLLAAPRG
jgi:DNA polymerase-3 subunit delta'